MGVEPGLEAVQGVSRHDLLRQTVPVWYGSREERYVPVSCPAGEDVIAGQCAGPLDLYGKEDAPALHESPSCMSEIAGVNTASLGGYLHSTKTRAYDELKRHVFDLERDGLRQVVLSPRLTMR